MSGAPGRREHPGGTQEGRGGLTDEVIDLAVRALELWRGAGGGVTIVAIDGHGASGKSTIAEGLCARTGASIVRTDDFFMSRGQDVPVAERGEPRSVTAASVGETGRRIGSYYDVSRLRAEGLEPLRAGREAVFRAFDWDLGAVSSKQTRVEPNDLVLLEGVYSGAPELGDLVDRAIYVDTPEPERLRRLRGRIAPEDWDEEWLRAEKEYFDSARPLKSFDFVIRGAGGSDSDARPPRAP